VAEETNAWRSSFQAPSVSLPKGGGAIRGMGEKFSTNPVSGSGSVSIPLALTSQPHGPTPALSLNYDSGGGNSQYGLGWRIDVPEIARKTDKGLPRYDDRTESDVFVLSGAEDLVPVLERTAAGEWVRPSPRRAIHAGQSYDVTAYRPRVEGLFATIERWVRTDRTATIWRSISRDNVKSWFGETADARVSDPADVSHTFRWLLSRTVDDRGHVVLYEYRPDDRANVQGAQAHEQHRRLVPASAQRYLKRVRYGNRPSALVQPDTSQMTFLFEAVLDYGEGHYAETAPDVRGDRFATATVSATTPTAWPVRVDPFSEYRAGFEVRTYRLLQRVLMFHRIAAWNADPVLVRATELRHDTGHGFSVLQSVTHSGYQSFPGRGLLKRSTPPLEFGYSPLPSASNLAAQPIQSVSRTDLPNLPVGLDDTDYQWIDLDGEGISGVLSRRSGAWYYQRNLGAAQLAPMVPVARVPSVAAGASARLMDLGGDGQLDVVIADRGLAGFTERTHDDDWRAYQPIPAWPNRDLTDPNVRFIDLTGDGLADLVVTEGEAFVWHRSLGETGFEPARRVLQRLEGDRGPSVVFSDPSQTLFLADMSGDGLTDLVRIRNGSVCYFPNLGYGRFGARVTMDDAPWFDSPEAFDPGRVRLADIDGSGLTDLVYLHPDAPRVYFNRSGNRFEAVRVLTQMPHADSSSTVHVLDLLGRGTACLVWSSPLAGSAKAPLRYIDLMGGQKPHLLIEMRNNLGATSRIEYRSSTEFYLEDRAAGRPWITRLPFPVHVVSRVAVTDRWRGTTFASVYRYAHGYYDGEERERRAFGRVEQIDVEDYGISASANVSSPYVTSDRRLYQPPIKTVTWYHTGARVDRDWIVRRYAPEFTRVAGFVEPTPPEPVLPSELTDDEWREAHRACNGRVLRQEILELDPDALAAGRDVPVKVYSTALRNYELRCVQPRASGQRHGVFLAIEKEALTFHLERDLTAPAGAADVVDPRVAQTLNVRIDEYGHTLESVSIGYPRFTTFSDPDLTEAQREVVRAVQAERHLALSTTRYTRDEIGVDTRRLRAPWETATYELTGIAPQSGRFYTLAELRAADLAGGGSVEIAYHVQPDRRATAVPQRRLVEAQRTTYFADDLVAERPLGECGARALPRERYRLALTRDLLAGALADAGRLNDALDALNARDAQGLPVSGYRRADQLWQTSLNALRNVTTTAPLAEQYWQASGVAGFSPGAADRFFQPDRYVDPFGAQTSLAWDPSILFVRQHVDALGNALTIDVFDFRTLAPSVIRDANDNVSSVAFDALGRVVVVAAQGKPRGPDQWEGDSLAGVTPALLNPPRAQVATFCLAPQFDEAAARAWLGQATARYVYHFGESVAADGSVGWGQQMAGACGLTRERHVATLASGELSPLQVKLECSDGMSAVLMQKLQAEPDPLGPATTLRWIVNGLTVLNNKGKPVMQFEPAFTDRFGFERPAANGVSTLTFYDAAGRALRTEMPDGTFSRVEFTPWEVRSFDALDTVLDSRWYAERTVATASVHDQRAARLSERLTDSPARVLMDALGRSVVSVAHQREPDWDSAITTSSVADAPWRDRHHLTFTKLDAEGKPLWMVDARGNRVMQYIAPALPVRTRLAADATAGDPDPYAVPLNAVPCYDLAGNLLQQVSMDSGARWMVSDAAGQPMLVWDRNETRSAARGASVMQSRRFRTVYDRLRRPVGRMASFDGTPEVWLERFEYLDTAALAGTSALPAAQQANLIGQTAVHRDASGVTRTERVNFTGNIEEISRQGVSRAASAVADWNPAATPPPLDPDIYRQITEYDALGRMTTLYQWHRDTAPGVSNRVAVYVPQYNARGLLRAETLHLRARKTRDPQTQARRFVADPTRSREVVMDLQYNEKGQKTLLQRGNGTVTRYAYDPWTYRLTELSTRFVNPAPGRTRRIQALSFAYDAAGQVVRIHDDAQPGVWQAGLYSDSTQLFVYDALSRLIEATGREHATMAAPRGLEFGPVPQSPFPTSDLLRPYRQRYVYDVVGNFRRLEHFAPPAPGRQDGSYTRYHQTARESNRLEATWYGDPRRTQGNGEVAYRFDSHGNHLNFSSSAPDADLRWDWQDMIASLDLNGGGRARYQYGSDRQRSRKIVERLGGAIEERVYWGGFERYRRWGSTGVLIEEIETLHVFEGEERMLLVEDVLEARRTGVGALRLDEQTGWRFQYGNHLGSVATELDQTGREVSYEEFHPYGTTAYVKQESALAAPAKRYRFTGMERDEESGLQYHSARYYAPWIARWGSTDPQGLEGGINLFAYSAGNPVTQVDRTGRQPSAAGFVRDAKNTGLSFAGGVYGAGRSIVGGVRMILNVVYYSLAYDIHDVTGAEYFREDALTAQRTFDSLRKVVQQGPGEFFKAAILARGDAITKAADAGDHFGASAEFGEVLMDLYQIAKAANLGTPGINVAREPARALVHNGTLAGGISISITPPPDIGLAVMMSAGQGGKAADKTAEAAVAKEVQAEYLQSQGVSTVKQLPFKSYWNLMEKLSVTKLVQELGIIPYEQVRLYEQPLGGKATGPLNDLGRIPDALLLDPGTGKAVVAELTSMKDIPVGSPKYLQMKTQIDAFNRAQQGASRIWARLPGASGADPIYMDVTDAMQTLGSYPHWSAADLDVIRQCF